MNTVLISDMLTTLGETNKAAQRTESYSYQSVETGEFGFTTTEADTTKMPVICDEMDYEITFWVKQIGNNSILNFGVKTFASDTTPVETLSAADENPLGMFFENEKLNIEDTWYFIRGIIYSKDIVTTSLPLNIGFGARLKLKHSANYIYPTVS